MYAMLCPVLYCIVGKYIRHIGSGGYKHLFGPRGLALQTQSCSEYDGESSSSLGITIDRSTYNSHDISRNSTFHEDELYDDDKQNPDELRKTMKILRRKLAAAREKEGMNDPFLSHTHTNVLNIHTYMHDEEQNMKQINESPFCFFAQRR